MKLILLILAALIWGMAGAQKTSVAYGFYTDPANKLMLISQSMVNVVYKDSMEWQHEMNAGIREALSEDDSEALGLDDAYNVAMFDLSGVVMENEGDEAAAVIKVAESERREVIDKAKKEGYRIFVFPVQLQGEAYSNVTYVAPLSLRSLPVYKAGSISKYLQIKTASK